MDYGKPVEAINQALNKLECSPMESVQSCDFNDAEENKDLDSNLLQANIKKYDMTKSQPISVTEEESPNLKKNQSKQEKSMKKRHSQGTAS